VAIYVRPRPADPNRPPARYQEGDPVTTPADEAGTIRSGYWADGGWAYWVELPRNRSRVWAETELEARNAVQR
jgi:hypothetical protein